jgi:two-component system, OmpR family, sensor histidine kinase KdpD
MQEDCPLPEKKIVKRFWFDLGLSVLLLTITTLACRLLYDVILGESIVIMLYLLSVFLISRFTAGYWYGVASSLLSVLLFNFFFTEPYFSLNAYDARYPLIFVIMLIVSLFTTASTIRIRKAAEDKIEQAKVQEKTRQIIESERMKGTILRSISHDLRTPLTSITGSVSILLDESQELKTADREELFQDIYQESIWLSRFVENLLSLSRIDDDLLKLQIKPELIEEILGETLVTIRRRLGNRAIKVIIPPEPVLVWLDSALIERVIINLLENAIAHTRDNGAITITVTCDRDVVQFKFWNNGPIIPPDIIDRIFERYFVGNEERYDSRRGMGLGLSICQSIVQAHHGTLSAENCADGGVAFTFTIPVNGGLNIHDKPDSGPDHRG